MALKSVYSLLVIHCEMCQDIDDADIETWDDEKEEEKE